ncbi:MAG: hydrolase 2, exosortase A system-associated [Woeseiaceae bacterium]|nr:hydrolase 2, exosortase A system-associated [Woeseiaceae bacterium]
MSLEALFLNGSAGRLFALLIRPDGAPSGSEGRSVIYCPPFAEEANRTRRAAVLLGQKLADIGVATLIVDPYGTGDSDGDFADARLSIWQDDLRIAAEWLSERGMDRQSLLGVRLGACVATRYAVDSDRSFERLVLWQPVVKGSGFLTQFLRLKAAHSLIATGTGASTKELREMLEGGQSLEIAGYTLSSELFADIDGIDLKQDAVPSADHVDWLEITPAGRDVISIPSQAVVDRWSEAGVATSAAAVNGERYWETVEIAVPHELLDATVEVFQRAP